MMIAADALVGVGAAASAQYGPTTTTADHTTTTDDTTTTSNVDSGAGLPTTTVTAAVDSSGSLPTTGSGGLSTAAGLAIGLIAVGFGLFAVTRARRGQLSGT